MLIYSHALTSLCCSAKVVYSDAWLIFSENTKNLQRFLDGCVSLSEEENKILFPFPKSMIFSLTIVLKDLIGYKDICTNHCTAVSII